ncbi:hypothetical protein [Rosenbergiella nectarea]|uniref:hypothetical protein n=1 Tax=Rosenbergiella nectarea TaxID=988801 RepID=UPI001F4DE918|nr:hypothetical protein [Rosenbergiella nectarea]
MPVSSIDFLNFAKDSISRNDEIGFRNAVARAYYCAYHHVAPIMVNAPQDSHKDLIGNLINDSWKGNEIFQKFDLIALGHMLNQMKGKRVISDYKLNSVVTESEATIAILSAEKLISKCSDMIKPKVS